MIFLLILTPLFVQAAEKTVWVEAEGQAYMSMSDTFRETHNRAKNDALRNAAEKATGVFIKSMTYVSNSQLAEDLIYASVKGKIEKSEIITEGWDSADNHLYRIKLRALVEPVYAKKGGGLSVKATLSKYSLKEDEAVKIYYKASQDAYIYIFSVAADGSVTLLKPNAADKDNHVKGGEVYQFPETGSGIVLMAKFLPGFKGKQATEHIKIIATRNDNQLLPLGFKEGMFEVFDAHSTSMVSDLTRKLNMIDPENWAETTADYTINR